MCLFIYKLQYTLEFWVTHIFNKIGIIYMTDYIIGPSTLSDQFKKILIFCNLNKKIAN